MCLPIPPPRLSAARDRVATTQIAPGAGTHAAYASSVAITNSRSNEDGGNERRRADSNRCIEVLQTSPLATWVRRPAKVSFVPCGRPDRQGMLLPLPKSPRSIELPDQQEAPTLPDVMRVGFALVLATGFLVNVGLAQGEIYRWVDEHGVTHLDDTLANVPETRRSDAKVFQAKTTAPAPATAQGQTQAAFANGIARELGLIAAETQGAVSALQIVGVYPSAGWNPTAILTSSVVEEVTRAARSAARARRLPQGEAGAEAAVLRVSAGLGLAGPPPMVVIQPEPPAEAPTIVVAPNIVVEAPPPTVIIRTIERQNDPVLTRYGFDAAFGGGVPFAPDSSSSDSRPHPRSHHSALGSRRTPGRPSRAPATSAGSVPASPQLLTVAQTAGVGRPAWLSPPGSRAQNGPTPEVSHEARYGLRPNIPR